MTESKIKAIIFDIGGVLQLGDYSKEPIRGHQILGVHNYIAKKLKIPLDHYFDSLDTAYAKSIEGTISEEQITKTIAKNLEISVKKLRQLFGQAYKLNFKLNKELISSAINLRKQGYKISVLSDQWYVSKNSLVISGIKKNFKPLIISCDVGLRKPNPKIYRLLIKKAKLKPNEILFIDNREWNMPPALKLGIRTILFKDNKQCIGELKKMGVLK